MIEKYRTVDRKYKMYDTFYQELQPAAVACHLLCYYAAVVNLARVFPLLFDRYTNNVYSSFSFLDFSNWLC